MKFQQRISSEPLELVSAKTSAEEIPEVLENRLLEFYKGTPKANREYWPQFVAYLRGEFVNGDGTEKSEKFPNHVHHVVAVLAKNPAANNLLKMAVAKRVSQEAGKNQSEIADYKNGKAHHANIMFDTMVMWQLLTPMINAFLSRHTRKDDIKRDVWGLKLQDKILSALVAPSLEMTSAEALNGYFGTIFRNAHSDIVTSKSHRPHMDIEVAKISEDPDIWERLSNASAEGGADILWSFIRAVIVAQYGRNAATRKDAPAVAQMFIDYVSLVKPDDIASEHGITVNLMRQKIAQVKELLVESPLIQQVFEETLGYGPPLDGRRTQLNAPLDTGRSRHTYHEKKQKHQPLEKIIPLYRSTHCFFGFTAELANSAAYQGISGYQGAKRY